MMKQRHTPVLADKVIELLRPRSGESFLDLTAGYGGHADLLRKAVGPSGHGYLVDQDGDAIEALKTRFENDDNITILRANYSDETAISVVPKVDMILLDLGVSSVQLDEPQRGFSFQTEARLDMRMDQRQQHSAYEIVNETPEKQLADILYEYGEERRSRQIAAAIVQTRRVSTIATTTQLAEIVAKTTPRRGKIHPATRTFAAIRIAVNGELDRLDEILPRLSTMVRPGGRIAIISFHSLEDRRVKQFFRELTRAELDWYGQIAVKPSFKTVTKKPVLGKTEDRNNPRARSAKLRAVEHIK